MGNPKKDTKTPELLPPGSGPPAKGDEAGVDDGALVLEKYHAPHEVAASAVAAEAEAEVKARVALAFARPRNRQKAAERIMETCSRPAFADLATWERPVGRKKSEQTGEWVDVIKEGPSIRLAEECARAWGNIYCTVRVIFESDDVRIVRVGAMDLETNWSESDDITIRKTVERAKPRKGDVVLKQREGSGGQAVYVIAADEGALLTKQNAEVAKKKRTLLLQLIDADVVEAAFELAKKVSAEADQSQLEERRKVAIKAFAKLNVAQAALEGVLKKPANEWGPAEIGELRRRHAALRDGEMTMAEFLGPAAEPAKPAESRQDATAKALGADPPGPTGQEPDREPGDDLDQTEGGAA